jgi:hypothetical protein
MEKQYRTLYVVAGTAIVSMYLRPIALNRLMPIFAFSLRIYFCAWFGIMRAVFSGQFKILNRWAQDNLGVKNS